jgi:hypothetical protein
VNLHLSIYDSTVNLATGVVHVVLVVFPFLSEKYRIGRPSVVEYGSAGRTQKNTESTICVAKMLLSVSASELLLLFFLAQWF